MGSPSSFVLLQSPESITLTKRMCFSRVFGFAIEADAFFWVKNVQTVGLALDESSKDRFFPTSLAFKLDLSTVAKFRCLDRSEFLFIIIGAPITDICAVETAWLVNFSFKGDVVVFI